MSKKNPTSQQTDPVGEERTSPTLPLVEYVITGYQPRIPGPRPVLRPPTGLGNVRPPDPNTPGTPATGTTR
jgi:hypothetical protein